MSGRLIAIVGPSGVGKDSVMEALAKASPNLTNVKRTITRAPGMGGEDYEPVTEAEFEARAAAGDFCLFWEAHGLKYGVPQTVRARLTRGDDLLVNLSRSVLAEARDIFPELIIFRLSASAETLASRLGARGRETLEEIETRLKRATWPLPEGVNAIELSNDGALSETVKTALNVLSAPRVS